MALTVAQGFDKFLTTLIPLQSQRDAASKHRSSVESSLKNALDVKMFRESGSSVTERASVATVTWTCSSA